MQLMQIVLLKKLRKYGKHLAKQQYRTIKGQILAGDTEGASKGMEKLIKKATEGGDMYGKEENTRSHGVSVGTATGRRCEGI